VDNNDSKVGTCEDSFTSDNSDLDRGMDSILGRGSTVVVTAVVVTVVGISKGIGVLDSLSEVGVVLVLRTFFPPFGSSGSPVFIPPIIKRLRNKVRST